MCPVCHSPKIKLSSIFDGWLTPEVYICMDCGYKGPIVLEIEVTKNARNHEKRN